MERYFVDLHIHIGATSQKKPVKITASRQLTFLNIIKECVDRKGIDIIGIVDCASPGVRNDIKQLLATGDLIRLANGGWRYLNKVTVLPGVEVESKEHNGARGHFVSFFPGMEELEAYSDFLNLTIKNLNLSTQQAYLPAKKLLEVTKTLGGIFFPAHAFTPHKSLYGSCGSSLKNIFEEKADEIKILELGLSSDSEMADKIAELAQVTFLTNSDAHSLEKIGREYNIIQMEQPTFLCLKNALLNIKGGVIANYGLDPKLGKYHRNFCENCQQIVETVDFCPQCAESNIVKGVFDRIKEIGIITNKSPKTRPPYIYQVPLAFLPKVGKKTIDKLINEFGSEMNILHKVSYHDLVHVVGEKIANLIILSRKGKLSVASGGGGIYGKVMGG